MDSNTIKNKLVFQAVNLLNFCEIQKINIEANECFTFINITIDNENIGEENESN